MWLKDKIMKKVLTFLALVIGFQSFAQDSVKRAELERVLVVGVRADKKTPITQKTIGDSSVQEIYQGQEVPMLLSNLPSIYANSDGGHGLGYTYFSLRGANQARINMTLNGVPLNEPEDHGVYTSNYPSFITSIQSIQIQRGVGTSSNGAASFIGSINFQSKSGLKEGTELQLGGGSYNTQRFNYSKSSGLDKNNMAYFVNVGGVKSDGFRENSGNFGGSVFASGGYYGDKRVTKVVLLSGFSRNEMAWDGTEESILKTNYRYNPRGNDKEDLFSQTHLQVHNINMFNKRTKLISTVFYNFLSGYYYVYSMKDLPTLGYFAKEKQNSNWLGYVGQLDYKVNNTNLAVGVSVNTYKRNHKGTEFYDPTTSFNYKNSGTKNEISGFVKASFGDEIRFYLDMQGRYVDFKYKGDVPLDKQSWFFFNPKAGLKYFIDKNFDFYYNIGISHREPTRSVLFNGGFYLTTLNKVKAEEVIDFEIGTNYKDDKVRLQSNLFYMTFSNEIIPAGPLGANSLPTMINVDKSSRYGFEFDIDYAISSKFMYSANTTISRSQFGDNKREQLFSPRFLLNQSLTYSVNKFSVNINQSYASRSYIDISNENFVDGFTTFGANVSYEYKNYKLTLQGNNLTNERYYRNGYAVNGVRYLFPNALANYYVTLRVKL